MKILHIIHGLGGGGRERRMSQLVRGLNNLSRDSQRILVLSDICNDYKGDIPKEVEILSISDKNGNRIRILKNLYRCIKEYHPDVVHLWTEINLILLGIAIFKDIFRFRLIAGFIADGNPVKSNFTKMLYNWVFRKSDAIVSNSKAGLLSKNANMSKSHVIYNGFDFDRFNSNNMSTLDVEFNLGNKKVISMCARFSPAKDWKMFLDVAFEIQKLYGEKVLFLAVGKGEQLDYYKELAKTKGIHNIIFTGQRNDIEQILLKSNISLLFSNSGVHAEGVSNSIMESMAADVPVIATAGGGTSEIITTKENGFIINPRDVEAAVNRIELLINDERKLQELGKNAADEIKRRFLLSDMVANYENLYRIVCE